MDKNQIIVDFRMHQSSGIGVYMREITGKIKNFKIGLLLCDDDLESAKLTENTSYRFNAKIYSIKEQLLFPFIIPQCDIFWSPHYNIPFFPIRAKKRVVTIHDVYHISSLSVLSGLKKWYAKLMLYLALQLSDKVITVSNFSKAEIVKHFKCNPDKITVIKNGVKTNPIWKDFFEIKDQYNLPERYLLFVGNIKPHKNIRKFLEGYLLLDQKVKETLKVVIVGKKEGFITGDKQLHLWIETNPILKQQVVFTGTVKDEDLDTIYYHASLLVFPSLYEGFGLPPLEAMVNDCPAIVSDIPVMREICGDAALYFDPLNPEEIMQTINIVIHDSDVRNNLVTKGKQRIKLFTWEDSAREHMKLFSSLFF